MEDFHIDQTLSEVNFYTVQNQCAFQHCFDNIYEQALKTLNCKRRSGIPKQKTRFHACNLSQLTDTTASYVEASFVSGNGDMAFSVAKPSNGVPVPDRHGNTVKSATSCSLSMSPNASSVSLSDCRDNSKDILTDEMVIEQRNGPEINNVETNVAVESANGQTDTRGIVDQAVDEGNESDGSHVSHASGVSGISSARKIAARKVTARMVKARKGTARKGTARKVTPTRTKHQGVSDMSSAKNVTARKITTMRPKHQGVSDMPSARNVTARKVTTMRPKHQGVSDMPSARNVTARKVKPTRPKHQGVSDMPSARKVTTTRPKHQGGARQRRNIQPRNIQKSKQQTRTISPVTSVKGSGDNKGVGNMAKQKQRARSKRVKPRSTTKNIKKRKPGIRSVTSKTEKKPDMLRKSQHSRGKQKCTSPSYKAAKRRKLNSEYDGGKENCTVRRKHCDMKTKTLNAVTSRDLQNDNSADNSSQSETMFSWLSALDESCTSSLGVNDMFNLMPFSHNHYQHVYERSRYHPAATSLHKAHHVGAVWKSIVNE